MSNAQKKLPFLKRVIQEASLEAKNRAVSVESNLEDDYTVIATPTKTKVDSPTQKKLPNEVEELNMKVAKLSLDIETNNDRFEELKKTVEKQSSEISKVHEKLSLDIETNDDRFEELKKTVEKQSSEITTLHLNINGIKGIMEQQLKIQKLAFALSNVHIGSFLYFNDDELGHECSWQSSDLVTEILQSFVNGHGYYLPDNSFCKPADEYEYVQDFKKAVTTQVEKLIGHEPRLVKESNGRHAIYYS